MRDQVGTARQTAGSKASLDLRSVVLVATGQLAEVAGRDPGEAGGLGDRQLVAVVAERPNYVGIGSGATSDVARRQLCFGHPSVSIREDRHQIRASDLGHRARTIASTTERTILHAVVFGRRCELSHGERRPDIQHPTHL
nr:hypothetical protein [Iamia sp. SCSIO 61187]